MTIVPIIAGFLLKEPNEILPYIVMGSVALILSYFLSLNNYFYLYYYNYLRNLAKINTTIVRNSITITPYKHILKHLSLHATTLIVLSTLLTPSFAFFKSP